MGGRGEKEGIWGGEGGAGRRRDWGEGNNFFGGGGDLGKGKWRGEKIWGEGKDLGIRGKI